MRGRGELRSFGISSDVVGATTGEKCVGWEFFLLFHSATEFGFFGRFPRSGVIACSLYSDKVKQESVFI